MPTYEYECKECKSYFTRCVSISERNDAEKEPCPKCGKKRSVQMTFRTAPAAVDNFVAGLARPDNGWQEVLQKVKAAHPGGDHDKCKIQTSR